MTEAASSLIAFTIAAGLITITPGLDTLLVIRTATVEGWRRGVAAGTGILAGCLVWGALVAFGLGALLEASEFLYAVLRICGGAYLIYLGISMLRSTGRQIAVSELDTSIGPRSWFSKGLLTNLLNPKVGVFYVTFLPPFVPAGAHVVKFTLLLAVIHALLGAVWFAGLIYAARSASSFVVRRSTTKWLDRVSGTVLVSLGLKIAVCRT